MQTTPISPHGPALAAIFTTEIAKVPTRVWSRTSGSTKTFARKVSSVNLSAVPVHHGRRHTELSGVDRQRLECLSATRQGGWGGRYIFLQPYGETHPIWSQGGDEFARTTSQDTVEGVDGRTHVSDQASIWRCREAYQNEFAARTDWTVQDFAHANHNPIVVVNAVSRTAPLEITTEAGQTIMLDASGTTESDGQALTYRWIVYPEPGLAGNQGADVTISDTDEPVAKISAKSPCRPPWLPQFTRCNGPGVAHIILAVRDNGSPRLTSYRRVILTVNPASQPSAPR